MASTGAPPEHPPVPRRMQSAWRREGLKVKDERARGHVGLRVWAGTPGTEHEIPRDIDPWGPPPGPRLPVAAFSLNPREALDHHARTVVTWTLATEVLPVDPSPHLWLTRSGSPEPCPEDLMWFAAADHTWRALGLTPEYAIVTREGWHLLPSGQQRLWRRLRA